MFIPRIAHRKRRSLPAHLGFCVAACVLVANPCRIGGIGGALAAESPPHPLERRFVESVRPFLQKYCDGCHGASKQEGKLDLNGYSTVQTVVKDHAVWEILRERLEAEEMPPAKAPRRPSADERNAVLEWIRDLGEHEARRNAGDPGPVPARRLSHREYDCTIRDLTGVDIRPTREFPVDPANEAGFDNSGESLTMSPALVKKYFAAAKSVSDHMVLKPRGFVFAPHSAVAETDRDKYCVQRIMEFYRRQRVDYADYFFAAWRFRNRAALGNTDATLRRIAEEAGLSTRYLETVWSLLTDGETAAGPITEVRAVWGHLPAGAEKQDDARRGCERMRDTVLQLRKKLEFDPGKLHVKGISDGTQPFVLWRNRQIAAHRMSYTGAATGEEGRALQRFCRVFPDAFFLAERSPYFDPRGSPQGRLLTAGFHLMQGYFRDDEPLCELVLDEAARKELDALWQELDFVTLVPMRQFKDYVFFERAEPPQVIKDPAFDFVRSEDKDVTSEGKLKRFEQRYLEKARQIGATGQAIDAIQEYFHGISARIREVERARLAAEPGHLEALREFTRRAYRRPFSPGEESELSAFYRSLRERDGLGHEEAMRDTLASVLLSPHFLYRADLIDANDAPPPAAAASRDGADHAVRPLSDYALASRLSYFLWSSMPDDELLARAAAGDLHKPDVLVGQVRRMVRDDRIRALALEFGGNWLEFRRFEEHNGVDRERFRGFTNELRQAMFEEPVRFFIDAVQQDRSLLEFLYADHTFVNPLLAAHYGMNLPNPRPDEWVRVDDAGRHGRGGLLPMAVFLTKNSPGLRTSPVKRGYWVVRRLLGEHIPAPPPEVPELPKDESKLGELALPQLLARHREHKSCAGCHQRFDAIGLAFEGYGPVGERRAVDLGGRPVEARATFPDGSEGTGLPGLQRYLAEKRQAEFVDHFARSLFAYALGRTLILSDKPTLANMRAKVAANGDRIGSLLEAIVTSPQFLNRRIDNQ